MSKKLNEIVVDWIKECCRLEGKPQDVIDNSGGKIFEFGSYRLGVHTPGTDIDALCVAPRHIDRDKHFFGILYHILNNKSEVSECVPVTQAIVPCIKMKFLKVDVDLLFARVELDRVDDNTL